MPEFDGFTVTVAAAVTGAVTVREIVVGALSVPEVPVIATDDVPAVAELLAANVTTLLALVGSVPKVAVTPLGKPEAAKVTEPVNGLTSVTLMVSVPFAPCVIDSADADGVSEKPPVVVDVTVSDRVVVAVSVPEVPVMVTVEVPGVAELLAANATALAPVVGSVPNAAVTPLGKPDATRDTEPANGLTSATEIVSVALAPCATESVAADDFREKLPVAAPPQVVPLTAKEVGTALVLPHVPLKPMLL
jgi:hypothetical protein